MLMSKNTAKEFMCPYSASGPKQFKCQGPKCAAFRWFGMGDSFQFGKRAHLEKNKNGEDLGYCSMTKRPDMVQFTNQIDPGPKPEPVPDEEVPI